MYAPPRNSELQALLDAAVDAIVVIDHRGRIERFNRAAERMFGYEAHEVIGQNVAVLMPEPDHSAHDAYMTRYMATNEARIIGVGREVRAVRKDGSGLPVRLSVGRIEDADPPRFVGILHDVSGRRHAEDEVRQAQERLSRVSRLATLGEMAAGISHELNQPLSAIANYAQAGVRLLGGPDPAVAEVDGALRAIAAQALRAGEIIRRLRSLVRHQEVRREVESPNELVRELASLLELDARGQDVRLRLDLAADTPSVRVDRVQVQQVVLNLVHNAVEALAESDAPLREVTVRTARTDDGDALVAVIDSGPGLPPELESRIFEPFFTTKAQGTGLGLAISRSIIEAHRSSLTYRRASPGGACFEFSLPGAGALPP